MHYYSGNPRFLVAVDCIMFGLVDSRLCLLLTKRRFAPEKGKWSLMGGFVQSGESVDDAARRVLKQLTGLDDVFMEQVGAFGEIHRDPGERVISVAYYALLGPDDFDISTLESHSAVWVDIEKLPALGFDHPEMINRALLLLRNSLQTQPVGFKLLPELFTFSQLQSLYETILGRELDKRNFRKRIIESGHIEKTDGIDKLRSRRGAALYRFTRPGTQAAPPADSPQA